jgi:hypothetical protein
MTRALAIELQGQVGVTAPRAGWHEHRVLRRPHRAVPPGPSAMLNDPNEVADAVLYALGRPAGCEVRELIITPSVEPSWP